MMDDVSEFAELNRLRTQGELSEAEYEARKRELQKVRSTDTGAAGRPSGSWAATRRKRAGQWWWVIGTAALVLVIGTYFFSKARTVAAERGEVAASPQPDRQNDIQVPAEGSAPDESSSIWSFSSSDDPMTDVHVATATTTYATQAAQVRLTVSCASDGQVDYTAATYDQDDQGIPLRLTRNRAGSYVQYVVRLDDNQAVASVYSSPEFNNQVKFGSFSGGMVIALDQASARRVVFRIPVSTGDATFTVDQTDPRLRALLAPCVEMGRATLAARAAELRQALAAQQAFIARHTELERANREHEQAAGSSVNAM